MIIWELIKQFNHSFHKARYAVTLMRSVVAYNDEISVYSKKIGVLLRQHGCLFFQAVDSGLWQLEH